jgi:peptidyl-prolyl cis-trans isomerase C
MRTLALGIFAALALGAFGSACKHKSTEAAPPATTAGPVTPPAEGSTLSPELRGKELARIDTTVITLGEFEDRILKQSPYIRHRYATRERKKEFLDNMVRFELMAKEAMAKGYDKDPEVQRTMKQVMIQKLIRNDFEKKLKPEDIPEPELTAYYEGHKREYNTPEQVRASHILVKFPPNATAAQKEAAKARATALLSEVKAKAKDATAFAELAKKHSDDTGSKALGGDVRYFSRTEEGGTMVKEFSDAAFKLAKAGDLSDLVETKYGYHVIRLADRRAAQTRTFESVKRQIQNRLYREKRTKMFDEFVKGLRAKAQVAINDALLDEVKISATPPPPPGGRPGMPGMPGGPGMPRMPPGHPSISITPQK